ncbi:MFS transporter [Sporosarcina pasteurii]|uniref:Probable 3-phenylpropionic acid transporter n=1 Tax=Sporosarcina pasteurii TaxID=1474 RepID=A0A380CIR6_SPOPA|nr:MFS transporter [Sporosarcina pasteurii]MDS9472161.1 MFS transporter [Sporosarcina pasteurii]QBQ06873.1 MFS transporter [Sporosarcina pasteurii]SUJ20307.1 Probable 3-phenylpropionic acid transporter [Sporosarcina pasteurii]
MNNQRWLSISFLAFFFTWGIFLPYWTGWLTIEKGLSVTAASIVMGAGMIARSFSTFLLFPVLTKRLPLNRIMTGLAFLSLGLALLYIPSSTFSTLLVITVLLSIAYPIIMPAIESSASILMQTEKIHYGKSRSFGSIGFTVALLIVGAITAVWSEQAILYVMIIGLAAICLFTLQPTPAVLQIIPDQGNNKVRGTEFKELFASKPFVTVLLLAVLLQGAHASYYNYGYIFLDDLGVNSFYIGIILNVAVLFEIIFFTQADKFFANMKISTMFQIAAIGSSVRWILIFLFPSPLVFIFTQAFHAISFGIAHFAFIRYISEKLPNHLIPTAQGLYASFAMSLSVAILTFVGGSLYDIAPNLAFLGMLSVTIPSIFIILMTKKRFAY